MVLDGWGTKHLCSSLDEAWNGRWRIGSLVILVWYCRVICSISCSVFNLPVFLELCICTSVFIGCQRLASIEAVLGTSVFLHTRAPTPSPETKFDTKYTIAIEERRERRDCFDVWAQGWAEEGGNGVWRRLFTLATLANEGTGMKGTGMIE